MSTSTDYVFVFGQLAPYLGRAGHIETIRFTDGAFSIGSASATSGARSTARVGSLIAASGPGSPRKEKLARAKKLLSKT